MASSASTSAAMGVTPNTPGGPHGGPNNLQNYPVLTSAATSAASRPSCGTLNCRPLEFTVDLYAIPTADPSGHGQGQTFLGSTTLKTDANGNASFSLIVPAPSDVAGQFLVPTATDPERQHLGVLDGHPGDRLPRRPPVATTDHAQRNPQPLDGRPAGHFRGDRRGVEHRPASPGGTVTFSVDGAAVEGGRRSARPTSEAAPVRAVHDVDPRGRLTRSRPTTTRPRASWRAPPRPSSRSSTERAPRPR